MRPRKRLLVIDRDQSLQSRFQKELESEGYKVLFASNGLEGLKKVREEEPDLVILDLARLETGAVQVLGWLLEENRGVPVVMNSKHPAYPGEFMRWLVDAFLPKSADLSNLKKTVRSLLRREHPEAGTHQAFSAAPAPLSHVTNPLM